MGLRKQISKLLSCFRPRRSKIMGMNIPDDGDDNDFVVTRVFQGEHAADENSNKKVTLHVPMMTADVFLSDKACGANVGVDIGDDVEKVTGGGDKKARWAESCLTEKHMMKMLASGSEQNQKVENELVVEDLE